jgi:hypothetical protein
MDPKLLRIFEREVERQCRMALVSAGDMGIALPAQDQLRFWMSAQGFLISCANISKALWGQAGAESVPREPLRASLRVSDQSLLRPTRFRNNFEHFDERIMQWWDSSPRRNFLDDSIVTEGAIVGLDQSDMFRHFDPSTGDLRFWADTFNVRAVVAELMPLQAIAAAAVERHFRLRRSP